MSILSIHESNKSPIRYEVDVAHTPEGAILQTSGNKFLKFRTKFNFFLFVIKDFKTVESIFLKLLIVFNCTLKLNFIIVNFSEVSRVFILLLYLFTFLKKIKSTPDIKIFEKIA
ncbi:hypothetical protein BpHYR1_017194 [Brachionus plicatilis]|uniref:Uncharacterized protein n=1 Tax=Brachionus plicatilis TaxID=10195 RepID=A0A3M7QJB9_BRAPC|nr:hypothetical protein BpHYR1_017194 [Brachionus plicatilis]